MVSEREWHRWANCRPNSLKINMVSRDTAKTSTVCQPIPVSYLHNNRLPFFFCPSSVTQYTGSNGSNILKYDGQISSLTFQMYLISFTGLFNWMRKNLQGQRTDTAFQNRVLFITEARRCAYHHQLSESPKRKSMSAPSLSTHYGASFWNTDSTTSVFLCWTWVCSPTVVPTDLMLNTSFRVFVQVCVTCRQKRQKASKQTRYNWLGTKLQGLQRLPGTTGDVKQVMWMMKNTHNVHLKHNWRSKAMN